MSALFFISLNVNSQTIANYVRNGGFEKFTQCSGFTNNKLNFWSTVDTTKFNGYRIFSKCLGDMPIYLAGDYQFPRTDSTYIGATFYSTNGPSGRSNLRSKLKANLSANKTYCVKFYVNKRNISMYGIKGFGAFFGDNHTLDTIQLYNYPLTYLTPQVTCNSFVTDTLSWTLVTGTFVASGIENNIVIDNFISNSLTQAIQTNTSGGAGCDLLIDDVSCIDIDLPAYAGPDLYALAGNTVYIGRPRDVGIDEACLWYKLPNTTTAIDTAAGITVTVGAQTATYMVKQDICGNIKYDTVVVYTSAVGLAELKMKNEFKIIPTPAQDYIEIKGATSELINISISDASGRILQEEKIRITA